MNSRSVLCLFLLLVFLASCTGPRVARPGPGEIILHTMEWPSSAAIGDTLLLTVFIQNHAKQTRSLPVGNDVFTIESLGDSDYVTEPTMIYAGETDSTWVVKLGEDQGVTIPLKFVPAAALTAGQFTCVVRYRVTYDELNAATEYLVHSKPRSLTVTDR